MTYKSYKAINDTTSEILENSSARIECKLDKILHERGINQTDLSLMTGIRYASINDLLHNRRHTINKNHLLAIMVTLELTSIEDIYEVVYDEKEGCKGKDEMAVNVDVQSLEEEIISFNNWNGAAWLCYNKEKNYFFTEVFANDVQASSTVVMNEEVSVVFSKKETVKNGNIGENRKAYIMKFVELLHKGYEPHEAEYHLAGEYL